MDIFHRLPFIFLSFLDTQINKGKFPMPTLPLVILCLLLSLLCPPQESPARDRSQVRAFLRSQGLTAQ